MTHPAHLHSRWPDIEGWLAAFFGTVLVIGFGSGILVIGQLMWSDLDGRRRFGFIAAGILWLLLDLPYMFRLALVLHRGQKPYAFCAAGTQTMMPLALRPIVSLWWLLHFTAGVWFATFRHSGGAGNERVLVFFLSTCYGYAANAFLILAVCALTRSDTIRIRAWRYRLVTDLVLGLVGLGILH